MAHAVRRRARERRRTARLAADREVSERRVYVQTPGRIVNVLIRKEFGGRIRREPAKAPRDRKSVVEGKRVDLGGRRIIKKKKKKKKRSILHQIRSN